MMMIFDLKVLLCSISLIAGSSFALDDKYISSGPKQYCDEIDAKCPVERTKRIVNGELSLQSSEIPHMVHLYTTKVGAEAGFMCGGSLIHESFVLTAAHCVNESVDLPVWKFKIRSDWSIHVSIGYTNLLDDKQFADKNAISVIVHKLHWDTFSMEYDIALVKLLKNVVFDRNTRPACLPYAYNMSEYTLPSKGLMSGWGYGYKNARTDFKLRKANVRILKPLECCVELTHLSETECLHDWMPLGIICVKSNRSGGCHGDSGGPLSVKMAAIDGKQRKCLYTVVGVVTGGDLHCDPGLNQPSRFVDVSHFVPWINNYVWPNIERKPVIRLHDEL